MLKGYLSLDWRHRSGVRRILYGNRLVNGLKNTLQIGDGGEQRVVKACQRVDGSPEPAYIGCKSNQYAHRNGGGAVKHPVNSQHIDGGSGYHGDNINRRPHGEVVHTRMHPGFSVAAA